MKTLLMTAIAAVFALQVQAYSSILNQSIPELIKPAASYIGNHAVITNPNNTVFEFETINKLNSLPMLDSLLFYNYTTTGYYFEYNSDGLISSYKKYERDPHHQHEYLWKSTSTLLYENNRLKSIDERYYGLQISNHTFDYYDDGNIKTIFQDDNPDGSTPDITIIDFNKNNQITRIKKTLRPTEDNYEYDESGRLKKNISVDSFYALSYADMPGLENAVVTYSYNISEFKYIEPSATQNYSSHQIIVKHIDSLKITPESPFADTAIITESLKKIRDIYNDSTFIEYGRYSYDVDAAIDKEKYTVKLNTLSIDGHIARKTSSIYDSTIIIPVCVNTITYNYENNIITNLVRQSSDWGIDFMIGKTFLYYVTPKALSLKLDNKETITVTFNCFLDATADVKPMLAIREPALKADLSALAIQRAYVNPTNAKELVIELNRPLEVREGFELYSTQDLPLKDGRFVPVSLVAQGNATTGAEQNVSGEITVLNDNGTVTVSAPQGIASAAMYSVAGMLVAAADGGNASEATISVGSLSAGVYYVHVTDACGNTSVQPVAIGK